MKPSWHVTAREEWTDFVGGESMRDDIVTVLNSEAAWQAATGAPRPSTFHVAQEVEPA